MAEPADDKDNARKLAPVGAIFVGMVAARNLARRGDDRPLKALEHAERLRKSGAGESQIYTETNKMFEGSPYAGVSYGADRKPRFEISDHNAKLVPAALDKSGSGTMGRFLKNDTYYQAHPDAALLDVQKSAGGGGSFDGYKVTIGSNHFAAKQLLGRPVAKETARGVALHEKQHHAQDVEGFAPGGSPKDFETRVDRSGKRVQLSAGESREMYRRLAGEVEAENTRRRANMTPAERRAIHPSKTAEFARKDQIVTDRHGRVQETRQKSPLDLHTEGHREVKIGNSRIGYQVKADGTVHVSGIRTAQANRGKGSARAAMNEFLATADAKGVNVDLHASPLDRRTGTAGLVRFYESLGFQKTGRTINPMGDPAMVRPAKPRIQEMAEDIKDFGEKIGGSRKDRAVKTGPKPARPEAPADTRPGWQKRFLAAETMSQGKPTGQWTLLDTRKKGRYMGHPSATRQTFPSQAAAEAAIPYVAVAQKHVVRESYGIGPDGKTDTSKTQFEIWRRVSDRKAVKAVNETFSSRDAAIQHMASNAERLLGTAKGYGEEILARPEKVVRTGPEFRQGDAKPEQFLKEFRFRGVEFGNWQGDRQSAVNMAYDAMRDLADITGVKPESLTFKERLALAFGARGNGGKQSAAAHYERTYAAVNLTREKGAGHLAHEWMHGLDHYLGTLDDPKLAQTKTDSHGNKILNAGSRETDYASHRVVERRAGELNSAVRDAYRELVDTMLKKPEQVTVEASRYEKQSQAARERLKGELDTLRLDLATEQRYGKKTAPATAEQLAKFDAIAEKLVAGEGVETKRILNPSMKSARNTNDAAESLSAIMKEVRGRAGWDSQAEQGPMDRLARSMNAVASAEKMLAQAKASPVQTVMTHTDFVREAARLDQSRNGAYWNTRHELAARAFSAYVEDKLAAAGRQSNYLAFGSDNKFYGLFGVKPFPEGSERQAINSKFDKLFEAMRQTEVMQPAGGATASGIKMAATAQEAMAQANAEAAKRVTIDGKPPGWSDAARAKSAEVRAADAKPEAVAAPAREVRQEGKRFTVHEGGKPIKDSKGADKWFGSKEKADAFLAKRGGSAPAAKPMSYERALSAAQGKIGSVQGDPHLAITAQTLSQAHPGISPKMLYDGAKALGLSAGDLRTKPMRDLANVMFAESATTTGESSTPKRDVRAKVEAKPRAAVAGDNGGPSEKAIKTAAKLEAVAKRTAETSQKIADQPRLMNTARRARLGSGVIDEANAQKAHAQTALKIAEALRNGEAGSLSNVKSLADVRALNSLYRGAMHEADRALKKQYEPGKQPSPADIEHAKMPRAFVRASNSDIDTFKKVLPKGYARDIALIAKHSERAERERNYGTTDDRVIEATKRVAKAVSEKGDRHQKWSANKLLEEIRDYDRVKGLGIDSTDKLKAVLKDYADVRIGKKAADPVAAAERDLIGKKLPGFFPTPASLAERMAQMADIKPGMQVLEPSAGTGRLADAAKKLGADVHAVEMQSSLRDILLKKGHNVVDHDFTSMKPEPKYDRIVMNPPFEKGQDIEHVRRAYEMLKPGGKMVAVMGEGAFFRGDKKAAEFRNWLESIGSSEKLPDGTFKESNTGVNTRLVTIEKPIGNGPQGWSDAARKASAEVRTIGDNAPKGVVQEIGPAATSGHTSIRLKIGSQEWSTAFRNDHPEGMLKHNIGSLRETYRKELASRFNEAVARGDTLDLKGVTLKTFAGSGQALDKVTLKPDHANALDGSRETTKGHGKRAWTAKAYAPDKLSFFGEEIPLASKQAGVIAKALGMPAFTDVVAEIDTAVKGENRGWSDAARTASAEARGVAKPGEGLPKAENAHSGYTNPSNRKPSPSAQSAVERAMAMQEAKLKAPQQSTLVAPKPAEATPTSASMSGSGSKRYVTLGDGRKVGLGQYTQAWKQAKALPPTAEVRGGPANADRGDTVTAKQAAEQFRAGVHDRINQKIPGFEQGRKWDATWQSDARRLAETMARKSEVPAGEAHPVDLRNKVADRLAPSTKLPPKGGTGIKGKVMGLMAPVAIGSAALIAMNESAKAGETTGQQVKAGSIEAVKGGAVMGGFVAGTIAITKGLTKAGLTAAKAVPATQAILMAGGAIHGAVTAKPGERMKGAAKGAWDMSVPGMVVNTYEAGKAAYHSTADRLSSPSRMTTEQAQHFNQANAAYKADHQSGPITVEQFERTRRLPSGAVVTETVSTHTRARRD